MMICRISLSLFLLVAACSSPDSPSGLLRVELDKNNPDRLMRFYMGAVDGVGGDSLLAEADGRLFLRADRLADYTEYGPDPNGDGVFDWDELTGLVKSTYYADRRIPATLDELRESIAYDDTTRSFVVEVIGTMSVATRRVFVPRVALLEALGEFDPEERVIRYPTGTAIVGEHWLDERLAEVTVMSKRPDGFWDFFVYDDAGALADSTSTEPRALEAPIQCAGCHFGTRAFEPEKSFPAKAPAGPDGPRLFKSATPGVTPELVSYFDEHRRRSDTVLGIYATLYIGSLLDLDRRGMLSDEGRRLVESVGVGR